MTWRSKSRVRSSTTIIIDLARARRFNLARLGLAAGFALGTFLLPAAPGRAHICEPDPELGVEGRLLLPSASGLALLSLPDRSLQRLPILPSSGAVNHVARSPDGARLAISRFSRPVDEPIGGADILVTGPSGGTPTLTIQRGAPGEVLGAPTWLPDGGLLFERQTVAGIAAGSRLERVGADGADRRTVAEQAAAPALSPDGSLLAFVRSENGDRLIVRPLEGDPERAIVDNPSFLALAFPRFSPDGQWIALTAVGDDPATAPTPDPGGPRLPPLGPRPARAHGLPWDVWLVRPDGSDLRRLTFFYDDDPATAWSPDGRWLAVFGTESLKIVSPNGEGTYCVLGSGGFGGLEWLD